ncbi:MAG: hypothetical protein NTX86_03665 [Candidatus Dependentiae bacterium]|nr:hypothetical protein [Candidatus Dependentiae bacterium]
MCPLSKNGIKNSLLLVVGLVIASSAQARDIVEILDHVETHIRRAGANHTDIVNYRENVRKVLCDFLDKSNNERYEIHLDRIQVYVQALLVFVEHPHYQSAKATLAKLHKDLVDMLKILRENRTAFSLGTKLNKYKPLLPNCIRSKNVFELASAINHRLAC